MSAVREIDVRALREDRGRFAAVRDARVLIYWPHGLGDWVHLGTIAPLLEPSNTYAIARFGDDYVSVMDANRYLAPLFSGVREPGDGSAQGATHFGVSLKRCNGRTLAMMVPAPLDASIARFAPDVLLWTDYPETEGRTAYPFHTKARNLARLLVRGERLSSFDLSRPLPSTIDFRVAPEIQRAVDERLARLAAPGSKICVISRAGVTAARKNWGDGSEARRFVATMRARDPRWHFLSMDGEALGERVAGFRALFGDLDAPFARVYKALAARIDLFVGVPAGPLHLTMARGGVPVVGLWLAHHPDWYDEPNELAVQIVGPYVRQRGFDRRPASTSKPPALRHRELDVDDVGSEAVMAALCELGVR
ncbi:MAG TPA: hypothetical protein VNG31_06335 [Candidatus Baltobacteraceae bacterium]|nr:hypothetical protein [Candidatus Baltobacteraceae bacterium]